MMTVVGKSFTCSFPLTHNGKSLKHLANEISQALGLFMEEDKTGYYEECPAYSAIVFGLRVSLISHPPWLEADFFEFEISMPLPALKEPGDYIDMGPFIMSQFQTYPTLKNHVVSDFANRDFSTKEQKKK